MIETLLPDGVCASEAFGPDGAAVLYPEEAALVAAATEGRREEFTTVRGCARRAMAALGLPPAPVLPGRRNVPGWPAGVVGSMTHCAGYRAAVLARDADLVAVGIDAEPDLPLPGGVLESIALPQELAWARTPVAGPAGVCRDRLLFSAKEAVYKTWYPWVGTELDFEDAALSFRVDDDGGADGSRRGTFRARVLRPGTAPDGRPVTGFGGRWLAHRGLVVTAIAVPARRAADPAPYDAAGGVGHPGR
ncbi:MULTISPECIES: 4'-phosphopantetheinyl transferase family protein [Streptomyces]|uniref:4'-phosphopantetheinyl transferase family protein n=1 Tax=Streptomyces TaxID=1883 RepID=UPI00064D5302|nr:MULTISPECIES: 4'-phosphopantetheinyl transferase superfamily protein [Streptomyces]AKL64824.1 4'-phosphopantetheinyl transferase [Streptomyces sp. Mg1]RPK41118.1 4'-phosphopantetheinyl transferase Npt [Streptomyces sp. ADI91-18]WBY18733.1 4'-phosphopantetheinyl transferase superfamily protein [Streptomyces goshikiensis]WSR97428.1 4'-phosphopantetheinyl transferase superfamily protein [Streptomyces goshikiensis]